MTIDTQETERISPEELFLRVAGTLRTAGMSAVDAETVSRVLIDASVRGHHSHGVELLPMYLDRIGSGGISVTSKPAWVGPHEGVVSILDASGGPGQVAMAQAVDHALSRALVHGAAVVGVRGNNHVGMLAAYRHAFVDNDATGLLLNISGPSVAAPGAQRATLGNGAVCLVSAVPGGDPFVADFATGTVAAGKIRHLVNTGEPVPQGWLLDKDGNPSSVAEDLDKGGSVPVFGGYKGLCVALIVEVLAGILAGDTISPQVNKQRHQPSLAMDCSQFILALDHKAFPTGDRSLLVKRLQSVVEDAYDVLPETYFPEQMERRNTAATRTDGIPVPAAVLEVLEP